MHVETLRDWNGASVRSRGNAIGAVIGAAVLLVASLAWWLMARGARG